MLSVWILLFTMLGLCRLVEVYSNPATDNRKKPILYLHPPLPKTARTHIEFHLGKFKNKLLDDSIVFIGKDKEEQWKKGFICPSYCLMYRADEELAQNQTSNCMETMNKTLQTNFHKGQDVVMSDQVIGIMMSGKDSSKTNRKAFAWLKDIVKNWDVHVLID